MALTPEAVRHSHAIDDLETKRATLHRMLASNRDLLADALDAVRNGRNAIAEEFIDRYLSAADAAVAAQVISD
jgi:hypothetical protein